MILFKEEGDFHEGALILVDKPLNWTSFDVVNKIRWCLRRTCGKIKVGHAGTLDPLATGMVIVCVGKWTKQIETYMGQEKEYIATIRLGVTTPSYDLETPFNGEYPTEHIDRKLIDSILPQFMGTISQIPPVFSAVRIDGVHAYEKARKGKELEMPSREVSIRELEVLSFNLPELQLKVTCSKGTYIRSLAHDIGIACKSGACLTALQRTAIGDYRIENANKMDDLVGYLQKMS